MGNHSLAYKGGMGGVGFTRVRKRGKAEQAKHWRQGGRMKTFKTSGQYPKKQTGELVATRGSDKNLRRVKRCYDSQKTAENARKGNPG